MGNAFFTFTAGFIFCYAKGCTLVTTVNVFVIFRDALISRKGAFNYNISALGGSAEKLTFAYRNGGTGGPRGKC